MLRHRPVGQEQHRACGAGQREFVAEHALDDEAGRALHYQQHLVLAGLHLGRAHHLGSREPREHDRAGADGVELIGTGNAVAPAGAGNVAIGELQVRPFPLAGHRVLHRFPARPAERQRRQVGLGGRAACHEHRNARSNNEPFHCFAFFACHSASSSLPVL